MFESFSKLYQQMGLWGTVITGVIVVLFIAGFYINILVRRRYAALSEELAAYCAGELQSLDSEMLAWATEEYKNAIQSGIEAINTTSIMETALEAYHKPCLIGESFLKKINGLLITTGLFGTFLGLTSAVGNLGAAMSKSSAETLMSEAGITTFKVLVSSFQGMSVAFVTSLFGTGFSILITLLMTFMGASNARKLFIAQMEEYLDIKVAAETKEELDKERIEHADEIRILFENTGQALTVFNQTLSSFSWEISSLKGFNQELSSNIDRASKSIDVLCQSFDKTSETVYESGVKIFNCSEQLKHLVGEIKAENQRMHGMGDLLKELSKKLDDTAADRQVFLKAVSEIPDKLLNYSEAAAARIERGR